jgi:hypothetical protein
MSTGRLITSKETPGMFFAKDSRDATRGGPLMDVFYNTSRQFRDYTALKGLAQRVCVGYDGNVFQVVAPKIGYYNREF